MPGTTPPPPSGTPTDLGCSPAEGTDIDWLLASLGSSSEAPAGRYLSRPSAISPRLLVPLENRRVARRALIRHHDDRTPKQRFLAAVAQGVAITGQLHRAPGEIIDLPGTEAVSHSQTMLGHDKLWPAVTLGPRRRNRKPVLQLVTPQGELAGYAKIGWSDLTRELVDNEAHWLQRIAGRLPEGLEAPRHVGLVSLGPAGADGSSRNLAVASGLSRPLLAGRTKRLDRRSVVKLARCCGTSKPAVGDLEQLHQQLPTVVPDLADRFLQKHGHQLVEVGIWHGDLTPWNTSTGGRSVRIWDWEFADQDRPVGFDLLHGIFEGVRRSGPDRSPAALRAMVDQAHHELAPLDQPVDATVDLYLVELLHREHRLEGQNWDGPLDSLSPHVKQLLERRLRS